MNTFDTFLESLTIEQAKQWDDTTEKTLFVDDDILGPANFRMTDYRLDAVENKFMQLLTGDLT